jgi:hypothetical protein
VLIVASGDSELEDLVVRSWSADTTTRVLAGFKLAAPKAMIEQLRDIHH